MRRSLKRIPPELRLERLLEALGGELLEASDQEILEAARDLGMNPEMKGSAAFLGIRHSAGRGIAEFFFGGPPGTSLEPVRGASLPAPLANRPTHPVDRPRRSRASRVIRRAPEKGGKGPKEE